MVSRWTSG
jgi:hypothetical protein